MLGGVLASHTIKTQVRVYPGPRHHAQTVFHKDMQPGRGRGEWAQDERPAFEHLQARSHCDPFEAGHRFLVNVNITDSEHREMGRGQMPPRRL